MLSPYFWEKKSLSELNSEEWEALCDRCGRCCTLKVEDENTHQIYDTHVICRYYHLSTGRCQCYLQRSQKVPDCVTLTEKNLDSIYFMPKTCAYRLLAEGKPLASWHPLICNNHQEMITAGIAIKGKVIPETAITDDLIYHLTDLYD